MLLEEEQVGADFQSRPGQPHDLYHQPQLRSRLQQIWVEVSRVVFFASSFNKQLRSSTHPHSLPKTFAETKKWKRANAAASCHQTILYLDFQIQFPNVSAPAIKLKKHDCKQFKVGKPLFKSGPFKWVLPVWGGGEALKVCQDGLSHLFYTSKLAISRFRGGQNDCQDGLCTFLAQLGNVKIQVSKGTITKTSELYTWCIYALLEKCRPYVLVSYVISSIRTEKVRVWKKCPMVPIWQKGGHLGNAHLNGPLSKKGLP